MHSASTAVDLLEINLLERPQSYFMDFTFTWTCSTLLGSEYAGGLSRQCGSYKICGKNLWEQQNFVDLDINDVDLGSLMCRRALSNQIYMLREVNDIIKNRVGLKKGAHCTVFYDTTASCSGHSPCPYSKCLYYHT